VENLKENLKEIMKKIMNERASKASSRYLDELKNLVSKILNKPNLRSEIYEIMETTIVKYKIKILPRANVEEK
jgi:hypothetical protein